MTSMSSTGFGQYPGDPGVGGYEQRTSVMAILSLVCSLICFIPGLAVLGAIFGIVALVAISRSGDRLAGRGLAISGLIVSLIVLACQIGIILGAGKVWNLFNQGMLKPATQAMVDLEQGNYAEVRKALSPQASKLISDEDLNAFRAQYQGEMGHFVSTPTTFMGMVQGYSELGPVMQQISGRNDTLPPLPASFDKGKAVLVFQLAPNSTGANSNGQLFPPVVNILIMTPSGSKWTLYDPQRGTTTPGTPPPSPGESKPSDTTPGDSTPTTPTTPTAPPTAPKEPEPVPEPKPGPG